MVIPTIGKGAYVPKVKSEHLEQVEFVQWMRRNHPEHRIFAIANGGYRSKSVGASLKAEGVTKGVPDLMIPSLRVFIEMKKTEGSTTSIEQKDWLIYLAECGYATAVCKGKDEAVAFIKEILVDFNK